MNQRGIEEVEAALQADPAQLASLVLTIIRRSDFELIRGIDVGRLREMVPHGIARAQGHGFTAIKDLTTFVGLMFKFGAGFDRQSSIRQLLLENGSPPQRTMADIVDQIPEPA